MLYSWYYYCFEANTKQDIVNIYTFSKTIQMENRKLDSVMIQ